MSDDLDIVKARVIRAISRESLKAYPDKETIRIGLEFLNEAAILERIALIQETISKSRGKGLWR